MKHGTPFVFGLLAAVFAACTTSNNADPSDAGSSNPLQCIHQACSTGSNAYEVCSGNGTTKYVTSDSSECACSDGDTAACDTCAKFIATWCSGGGSDAGSVDASFDGGVGNDGGTSATCSITLSGAVTGTFACTAHTTYATQSNLGGTTIVVGSPSPLGNLSVAIQKPGMPMVGTYSSTDTGAKGALVVQQPGQPSATWEASAGGGSDQGTYTMTLTSIGPATATSNEDEYPSSGTVSATLPAITGTGASGTVTLQASF